MASLIPQLTPIEISQEKKRELLLTNVIKMITERKLLNVENINNNIKNIINEHPDNDIYNINTINNEKYTIIFLNQKITSITKNSIIGEYIYKDKNIHKIIIVNDISSRSRQSIRESFLNIEIFLEKELMFNIVECIYVPKHEILSKEDADNVIREYNVTKRLLPYISVNDPMALYFNMSVGQICRITRPSETAGYSNFYRIVVNITPQKK
jgi:DNA-directed RNA polymerase subunit H (RpoH/RPB5)